MNRHCFLFGILLFAYFVGYTQQNDLASNALRFINSLTREQQSKAVFPFEGEERYNFHFVPRDDRKGISLNEMEAPQKEAAMALMRSCLSNETFQKTTEIMQLDIILKELEHRPANDHYRDPGKYFFTIFGVPGPNTIWGWRVEGHHISFNFSAQNNKLVAGTPGFLGANPAVVQDGAMKGKQVLKDETNFGFDLLHAFSKEQVARIVFDSTAPGDIFTFDKRKAMIDHPSGLAWSEMNSSQQQSLLKLVSLYVHRFSKLFADDMLKEIQAAGLNNLHFSWAGAQQPGLGHPHYYRIQGPTIIIEYDNTQNNANHVHSVVRDLLHDFGGDELMEHYKSGH